MLNLDNKNLLLLKTPQMVRSVAKQNFITTNKVK